MARDSENWRYSGGPVGEYLWRMPEQQDMVGRMSYPGAARYCAWLGGEVVTEAVWMKMARGDGGRVLPWAADPTDPYDAEARWDGPSVQDVVGASWRPEFDVQVEQVGLNAVDVGPYGHHGVAGLSAEWTRDAALPYDVMTFVDPLLVHPPGCEDCFWRVVVGNWNTVDPAPDIRFRAYGSDVDIGSGGDFLVTTSTFYSTRCVFDAEPPTLCRRDP